MALQEAIDELKQFDLAELDLDNIGSWPVIVRGFFWALALVGVLVGGYYYVIADLRVELEKVRAKEVALKQDFEKKAFKAAKLEPLKKQMAEMEKSFTVLLGQLPIDTEVPGLLEDMTDKAVSNGLEINSIKLQPERAQEFYIELPIAIQVTGSYHDLAAFVSGIAGLPRIVTLHDYTIKSNGGFTEQSMSITARTYRYRDSIQGGDS